MLGPECTMWRMQEKQSVPRLQVPCGTYRKNEKENQGELLERQKEYWGDKVMKAQWIKFQGEYD